MYDATTTRLNPSNDSSEISHAPFAQRVPDVSLLSLLGFAHFAAEIS